jgi:hypothetical protein
VSVECTLVQRGIADTEIRATSVVRERSLLPCIRRLAQGRRTRQCSISGSYHGVNRRLSDVAVRTELDPIRNSQSRCSKCPSALCEII